MDEESISCLESGVRLFAELPASSPDRRAWLGIYPFKGTPFGARPDNSEFLPWRFRIRKFEVDRKLIDGNYDVHEEELLSSEHWIVETVGEVSTVISRWKPISLARHLDDYPI
jgi:hypothetical protein